MKKIMSLCISLMLFVSLFGANVFAHETEKTLSAENRIYVSNDYNGNAVQKTRGNCSDVYTKEWCDSHGYENNRPVPGSVQLTDKESECYFTWVANALESAITSLVTVNYLGLLVGTPFAAYKLFLCMS